MTSARLFIRNDDVWTLEREFRFFFDAAFDRGIPVVHAVIPGKMDRELVRFLCRAKEKAPRLLDIVQHGWMHANHSDEAGAKYEFGRSRSLSAQRKDIQEGLKLMSDSFGELFTPAFVPPYHGYNERTIRVLGEEGFKIFSAGGRRQGLKMKLIDIPAPVSFSRYDQGQKSIYDAGRIIADLLKSLNRRSLAGVLTHHRDFKGVLYRRELTRFFDYIAPLQAKKEWRVLLFSEILSSKRAYDR